MTRALLILACAGCYNVDALSLEYDASVVGNLSSAAADLASPSNLSSPDLKDAAVVATWKPVTSPVTAQLRALCADGDVFYVAGASSTVLRIAADNSITQGNPGPGYNLRGAAAAGGDVWLVGDDSTVLTRATNGWSFSSSGGDTLNGAFGLAAGDLLSVGSGGHFDRNQTPEDTGAIVALFAVWARSETDVFAVGEAGTIVHRGSDAFTPWMALTSNVTSDLHGVWGNANTVYAAGTSGTLLRSDNGTSWSAETTPSSANLYAVWVAGSEAFAVGSGGTILHRSGGVWSLEHSGGSTLRAVLGRSATDVWAVGDDGTLLHYQP